MLQMIEANWLVFILALLIGIVVAWWVFARGSSAPERDRKPDALDEGAAPAQRNQALIDAPPAADIQPPPVAGTMAGVGEVVAAAAHDEVVEADSRTQAAPSTPAPEAAPPPEAPAAADPGEGDDLSRIKGVGPKLVALLQSLGIVRYEQIAGMSDADLDELDAKLGAFAGRPRRDNWVEQARMLQSGDTAAYEAKFGKL